MKKQLIIIDDDKPTANYNAELAELTKQFSQIFTFESAESAIEFLEEQKKDNCLFDGAVIVDVYMDEMDGLEFLDEVDDQELVTSATEVLVLTAKNSARSREKTKTASLNAVFSIKPLTIEHLQKLANKHA